MMENKIIAHRGASNLAHENTLDAFQKAVDNQQLISKYLKNPRISGVVTNVPGMALTLLLEI